jgi:hypothetical protein
VQHEVATRQKLLGEDGIIKEPGYARQLVWEYNRSQVRAGFMRLKEWDYYLVVGKGFAVAFTVSDMSYIGLASVSLLDLRQPKDRTRSFIRPLPLGKTGMPQTSALGDVHFKNKSMRLDFIVRKGERRISCDLDDLDGETFIARITLEDKPQDTMCIATTWKEKPTRFYLNQKINCMRASGTITLGTKIFNFSKEEDFGTLDWGRGAWTYDNTWFWGTCSCLADGKPFGFNLGYGFSDRSPASENMLFFDGEASKLAEIVFNIPKGPSGYDYMSPWTIVSDDGRFYGDFKPVLDRKAIISAGPIMSDQHQVFGEIFGKCVFDSGQEIEMKGFCCSFEHVHNKY